MSSPAVDMPMTLDVRLGAIRRRRLASRVSQATTLAAWSAGLAVLVAAGGCGLLNSR